MTTTTNFQAIGKAAVFIYRHCAVESSSSWKPGKKPVVHSWPSMRTFISDACDCIDEFGTFTWVLINGECIDLDASGLLRWYTADGSTHEYFFGE